MVNIEDRVSLHRILFEHKNYAIHCRSLKFLVDWGVEVRAVHKALAFEQKAWLKPDIDLNTEKKESS